MTAPTVDMDGMVCFTKAWHSKPYSSIDPSRPELSAAGKFIAITGGGTGIGKSIAISFAQAGASTIAILGRRLDRLETAAKEISEASGGKANVIFETTDVRQRSSVDTAVTSLVKKAGGANVDVLFSNAGSCPTPGPIVSFDEDEFRRGFESNAIGALNTIQAFAPVLATNAYIFNTSSSTTHIKPVPGLWAYTTIKFAIIKMFEYLQVEHPEWHVVQIQPGVVLTELTEAYGAAAAQDDPMLVGHFAVWLTSPEAKFLKGKFVWANWDVDELKARADEIQNSARLKLILDGVPM